MIPSSTKDVPKLKKRRLHGACDACRKRKGDSAKMPGNICTNCREANILCGHIMPRQLKKKGAHPHSYIRSLEERLETLERSLQDMRPENDLNRLNGIPGRSEEDPESSLFAEPGLITKATDGPYVRYPAHKSISIRLEAPGSSSSSDDTSEAEDLAHVALAEHMSQLSTTGVGEHFFGQSSVFMFSKHASTVRSEMTGIPNKPDLNKFRRPIYWDLRPWEMEFATMNGPSYIYPQEDLLESLVSIYFEKINTVYPLLHQPTFLHSLSLKQHLWDPSFGMTVLLVCAVASQHSQDPRVVLPVHRNHLFYKSTIYDLQYYVLAVLYLLGTSVAHVGWNILGLAMRNALEKGAHRRKGNSQKATAEGEQLKRAFWCMVCIDRLKSSAIGRPCIIQDEDFDVDYPIECDDEYWETEDPEQAFKQPPGKPCKISAFVCTLKLCEILAFAVRTLYSTKKSKVLSGLVGDEWERRVVAELDSSLNKWKDSRPQFLRWEDTEITDDLFFHQSVSLQATYYYVQILIHRPFLAKKSALSFPSLAICTNAARSCSHVLEVAQTRGIRISYSTIISAFASGIIIILNLWGHQRSGLINDPSDELANLQKCLNALKEFEKKWHIAGRLRDLLNEVGSLSEYSHTSRRHQRDSDSYETASTAPYVANSATATFASNASMPTAHLPDSGLPPHAVDNTVATTPTTSWDLNNLLLAQMGYLQPNLGDNMELYSGDGSRFAEAIPLHSKTVDDESSNVQNTDIPGSGPMNEDMFSLWSDIPVAFSIDEWDAYLSSMGQA
ncbi:fungal-specific transcription factor domain-containing protein [Flammula alnicola]|nr:fungal-specific transcription factor domain-containing protein [Flammula alnicola]